MGDETKSNELDRGNTKPLQARRKPTTAESVDTKPSEMAQMPESEEELPEKARD